MPNREICHLSVSAAVSQHDHPHRIPHGQMPDGCQCIFRSLVPVQLAHPDYHKSISREPKRGTCNNASGCGKDLVPATIGANTWNIHNFCPTTSECSRGNSEVLPVDRDQGICPTGCCSLQGVVQAIQPPLAVAVEVEPVGRVDNVRHPLSPSSKPSQESGHRCMHVHHDIVSALHKPSERAIGCDVPEVQRIPAERNGVNLIPLSANPLSETNRRCCHLNLEPHVPQHPQIWHVEIPDVRVDGSDEQYSSRVPHINIVQRQYAHLLTSPTSYSPSHHAVPVQPSTAPTECSTHR